jgi:anti-sigma B factor antagonist
VRPVNASAFCAFCLPLFVRDFPEIDFHGGGAYIGSIIFGVSVQIRRTSGSDPVVLSLKGDPLGERDAFTLRQKVYELIENGVVHVILDLKQVKHINSAGLGGLISSMVTLRKAGGDVLIAQIGKNVESVFTITHLSEVFSTFDTVEQAQRSFKP